MIHWLACLLGRKLVSSDASLPQTFVLELPRQSQISQFSFDNATEEGEAKCVSKAG